MSMPTPSPSTAIPARATRCPSTMYPAHSAPAISENSAPSWASGGANPANATTPPMASTSAPPERRVRVPNAATAIGPMNSIATEFPSGTRSMAR